MPDLVGTHEAECDLDADLGTALPFVIDCCAVIFGIAAPFRAKAGTKLRSETIPASRPIGSVNITGPIISRAITATSSEMSASQESIIILLPL
jgi:hypothetical protein